MFFLIFFYAYYIFRCKRSDFSESVPLRYSLTKLPN